MKVPANDDRVTRRRRFAAARSSAAHVLTAGVLVGALVLVAPAQAQTAAPSAPVTSAAASGGIGVAPAFFRFDDTFRGGTYSDSLILENGESRDLAFELSAEGSAAPWVTFTMPDDRGAPIRSVVVAGRHSETIRVQVRVPDDTANASYSSLISVRSRSVGAQGATAESGSSLGLGASVKVDIAVTGTQRRVGMVPDFAIDPAEVGMRQRFVAQVRNQGVSAQ